MASSLQPGVWHFLALSLLSACLPAFAQEPLTPAVAPDEPRAGSPEKPADEPPHEQTIYIPYTKLRQIFEKEGRGVFVPYDEFQRLWKAARDAARRTPPERPPVAALIASIDSQAAVSHEVMTVSARLQIDVLAPGWHYVFLRLKDAAIQRATLAGRPARLLFEAGKGYWVLVEKEGTNPERLELELEYSRAFQKEPGLNSVEFDAPQAAVNRWQIRIPEPGVKVNVQPNLSASTSEAEAMNPRDPADDPQPETNRATVVQAFVGAAERVRVDWTARAEGAAGLAALVTVQVRQEITISEGVIRTRATLTYDIQRADVSLLTVEVPADHNVVNVFDPNVQKWEKSTQGDVQTLTITLFQPTRGTQNVVLELEKFAADRMMPEEMTTAEIAAPIVRAAQAGTPGNTSAVGRQQGLVVVRLGGALRGEPIARAGLTQIDAAELPAPLAGQPWNFAFRYAALPFDLTLSIERQLPHVEVAELVEVYLEPHQITADLLAVLEITRAGIFQIELEAPEGYEVAAVEGRAVAGAEAAGVDSHHWEEVEVAANPAQPNVTVRRRTKLIVSLNKRALGKVGLWVELVKRQDDPNLLAPTQAASSIPLPLPRVQPARVARVTGRVLLYAPEALRVNPQEPAGLRPVAPAEAVQSVPSSRGERFPALREVAAYGYTQEAARLVVEAERRRPYVEARQLLAVQIEAGLVRYQADFWFEIKHSGVPALRMDVPASVAERLRNLTPGLREQRLEPQPADVPAGYVAWQVVGERELIGEHHLRLVWEHKPGELPVGQPLDIELPQLRVIGADRFWGQIVASKAETIEISVKDEPKGLRPIDPQRDLMPGAEVASAARAFEFHEEWALAMQATRYQLEEVKRTSIDRALVRMVVTRSRQIAVQALYRLRSARQRVPVVLPGVDPQAAASSLDAQSLRINNQPAALEHDGRQFFIPLAGQTGDAPVLVELRYTIAGGPGRLQLPEFPEDPAVQQVHLAVWLPEEWQVLAVSGPWTDEAQGAEAGFPWSVRHGTAPDDASLAAQVREGLPQCETAGDGFSVDGRRYVFSTLRPAPGPAGALSLTTAHRNLVSGAVFAIVALAGLALTARPLGQRLWWLAALVTLVVLAAVFAPPLAEALWGAPLALALALVLLVWLVQWLARALPLLAAWQGLLVRRAATVTAIAAAATTAAAPPVEAAPPPPPDQSAAGSPDQPGASAHVPPAAEMPSAPRNEEPAPAADQPQAEDGGANHG